MSTDLNFHHVALGIPAGTENEARAFYAGLLGLREIEKPEPLRARGGAWFESAEGIQVHLQIDDPDGGRSRRHFALVTPDGSSLQGRLEEAAYRTQDDPDFPGFTRFYVDDPWGNRIEILTPDPARQ
ncbi:MAG: VOC family protein [Dehalococcoidia bacterium]